MGIIAFVILGLMAGVIAKALLPGDDPGGFIITALIGVAGAVIGGFLAGVLFNADPLDEFFDISTWLTAIVGAVLLLLVYRFVVDRGHGRQFEPRSLLGPRTARGPKQRTGRNCRAAIVVAEEARTESVSLCRTAPLARRLRFFGKRGLS